VTGSQTSPRQQALRDRLLLVTEQILATEGLGALRARDLARQAGCAVGAIYTAYPDIDALILAANARTLDAINAALAELPPPSPGPDGAARRMEELAGAYLDFALANRSRWDALFAHCIAGGQPKPLWYQERQSPMFRRLEELLAALCPKMTPEALPPLARTLFSAVHGIVLLGLEEKLVPTPLPLVRAELTRLVRAIATGLRAEAAT
jgi:AcrR family transcriptional regulator